MTDIERLLDTAERIVTLLDTTNTLLGVSLQLAVAQERARQFDSSKSDVIEALADADIALTNIL